jgi:[protein-PII] uridylyltransferase
MTQNLQEQIQQLASQRRQLINSLKDTPKGLEWCAAHSEIADKALCAIYDSVKEEYPEMPPVSIIASGGYGRREISPYSDISVTVVPYETTHLILDAPTKNLYYNIQTAFEEILGLNVQYSYLLMGDVFGLDATTLSNLLDNRLVAGSPLPLGQFMKVMWANFPLGDFLVAKIADRNKALRQYNDTPLVVEPHIKEGAGGLRCFQTANWINKAIHQKSAQPLDAYQEIVIIRNLLHYLARKPMETLTRPMQKELAELLQIETEDLMPKTIRSLIELHQYYVKSLDQIQETRFELSEGVTSVRGEVHVSGNAGTSEAAIGIAIGTQLGLKIADISVVTNGEVQSQQAMSAIAGGEKVLRNLDRCGILKQLLPELDRCRTLIPRGEKHLYTVLEHTFRVIRYLDNLSTEGNYWSTLMQNISDIEVLYFAALLHDAGKIEKQSTHASTGEKIVYDVARRWGMYPHRAEVSAWLVREHQVMSRFINLRDVSDLETAKEFAQIAQNKERLALLALLTWADSQASAATDWSLIKERYLQELYESTLAVIEQNDLEQFNLSSCRQKIYSSLKKQDLFSEDIYEFVNHLPAHYLFGAETEKIEQLYYLSKKAEQGKLSVQISHNLENRFTEITICYRYNPKALSWVLGVFYALGLNLDALKTCNTQTENPISLNVFTVTFGKHLVPHSICTQIEPLLNSIFNHEKNIDELLWEKSIDPGLKPSITRYRYQEGIPGILEIQAHEERGLAYRITRKIAQMGWNIHVVRLGVWSGHGAASFYITGENHAMLSAEQIGSAFHGKTAPLSIA